MDLCNRIGLDSPVDSETESEAISQNCNIDSRDPFLYQEIHPLAMCLAYDIRHEDLRVLNDIRA
jgi:hypothetical protein